MRKPMTCLTLALFVASTVASSQTVAPNVMPSSAGAGAGARVGVAAGVKGSVQLARDGGVGKVVSSCAEIFLVDKISTDAKGGLQILLLDQTTFTIGANSAIVVDQFIYDPANDAGKVSVRVVEGTFRFITGKIAHKNPENMQVDLPNGTIGVRGTMVMGRVNGTHSQVILTGPGDKNNTGSRHGAIIVHGRGGDQGKSVHIAKTGFGTDIEGGGEPKAPFKVSQAQLDEMTSELSPEKSEGAAGGEKSDSTSGDDQSSNSASDSSGEESVGSDKSATELGGQDEVDAGGELETTDTFSNLSENLGDDTTKASQDQADDFNDFFDGITTVEELGFVTAGKAHFEGLNFLLYDVAASTSAPATGTFNVYFDINFADRKVGGGNSRIEGHDSNLNGNMPFKYFLSDSSTGDASGRTDFGSGEAIYSYSGLRDAASPSPCGGCSADVDIAVFNSSNAIAANALAFVSVTGGSNTAEGAAIAPRIDGSLS